MLEEIKANFRCLVFENYASKQVNATSSERLFYKLSSSMPNSSSKRS